MSLSVMLQQLCRRYGSVSRNFCSDTGVFTASGTADLFRQNVQKSGDQGNRVSIHFHYAWNTSDAAADGCIFRSVFYLRDPYFHGIQPDRSIYCVQHQLCCLFCRDLQRWY